MQTQLLLFGSMSYECLGGYSEEVDNPLTRNSARTFLCCCFFDDNLLTYLLWLFSSSSRTMRPKPRHDTAARRVATITTRTTIIYSDR